MSVELSHEQHGPTVETAWNIVRGAAALAEPLLKTGRPITFGLDFRSELRPVKPEDPEAVLAWSPGGGWRSLLAPGDGRSELLNLYLPICSATSRRPMTIGHLGQSLDGFIATPSGDSQFVTGDDNIVHLHRMRALSDAVVVGAGTVAADDPQLTVRHVPGPNPLRVVFDPARRLAQTYRVFTDDTGPTCTSAPGNRGLGRDSPRDGDRLSASIATTPAAACPRPCAFFGRAAARASSSKGAGSRFRRFSRRTCWIDCRSRLPPSSSGTGVRRSGWHRTRVSATAAARAIACSGWVATCCSTAT